MFSCMKMGKENKETPFMKNGRMLLEELIASCDGKCNPIRSFSGKELSEATNNYHHQQILVWDSEYKLYKGFWENRPISVKKYVDIWKDGSDILLESAITDIIIGSQMSVHKNVLKLIGCCLETPFPIVVYEFAGHEILSTRVSNDTFGNNGECKLLSWKSRIKIAADISNAIAYLHTALSRPVVLRDIRLSTIILSDENVPKLIDFSLSISIPDGQSHIMTDVRGRTGYAAPEYVRSGYASDKLDVYDFGIQILRILTGKEARFFCGDKGYFLPEYVFTYVENKKLIEIIDPTLLNYDIEQQQLLDVGKLALSCVRHEADERPTMTDVATQLWRIYESIPSQK